jgi:hypothetical protein
MDFSEHLRTPTGRDFSLDKQQSTVDPILRLTSRQLVVETLRAIAGGFSLRHTLLVSAMPMKRKKRRRRARAARSGVTASD